MGSTQSAFEAFQSVFIQSPAQNPKPSNTNTKKPVYPVQNQPNQTELHNRLIKELNKNNFNHNDLQNINNNELNLLVTITTFDYLSKLIDFSLGGNCQLSDKNSIFE